MATQHKGMPDGRCTTIPLHLAGKVGGAGKLGYFFVAAKESLLERAKHAFKRVRVKKKL